MKAVLCGYGVVGKGVEILCDSLNLISIEHVFVRKEKEQKPYFINDINIVSQPEIDIVFECLNGLEPANTLVTKALQAGKHVITSNKALIATYLDTYLEICKKTNATIQIEACVAGGIPFLDALLKLQRLEPILGYEGIFNGTSNYILDQMQKNQVSYQDALQKAKDKGYAEFDSTNDTEGIDVWYKAKIANALSYQINLKDISAPIGISNITEKDIEFAKNHHGVIRHVALSSFQNHKLSCVIAPAFYPRDHFLANVPENYNAQFIYAHSFSKLGYFGQGAGQLATAQAMVQNALDCVNQCIRLIHCEKQEIQSWHQNFDWIVRTQHSLIDIKNKLLDQNIYLIKNQPLSTIQSIIQKDKDAMIALWRIPDVENY